VDTPGLNEGAVEDVEHTLELLETLQRCGSVAAVIFCVRMDTKLDFQFQNTVLFYATLFEDLRTNFIVVITNVAMDLRYRELHGLDINENIRMVCARIQSIVGEVTKDFLNFPVICIDGYPFLVDPNDEEYKIATGNRTMLLEIIKHEPSVSVKEIRFQKTDAMRTADMMEISVRSVEVIYLKL
jgi:hypothetical protein